MKGKEKRTQGSRREEKREKEKGTQEKRREEKRREEKRREEKRREEKSYSSTPILGLHSKLQVNFTSIRWKWVLSFTPGRFYPGQTAVLPLV
jgi:hypothetical protein